MQDSTTGNFPRTERTGPDKQEGVSIVSRTVKRPEALESRNWRRPTVLRTRPVTSNKDLKQWCNYQVSLVEENESKTSGHTKGVGGDNRARGIKRRTRFGLWQIVSILPETLQRRVSRRTMCPEGHIRTGVRFCYLIRTSHLVSQDLTLANMTPVTLSRQERDGHSN